MKILTFRFRLLRELVQAGYLTAIDASSFDGISYLDLHITIPGAGISSTVAATWGRCAGEEELIADIERLKGMLIAVSTGGPRIDDINDSYRELYAKVDAALKKRGINNSIPYPDLWDWYGRWRSGDLPSYQSRRQITAEIIGPLIAEVRQLATGSPMVQVKPTGWQRVDRTMGEIRRRLAEAVDEEHFQAVGLLCREVLNFPGSSGA